ncbi:MAG: phosphatidate cytidylyltransferase [Propionibacteriaceae bacterium]|jgi:phosphatidate cytidylyltransferase|nr:phosphatidate cytidylyltransferase [Propionibacteriaceae bacterium]
MAAKGGRDVFAATVVGLILLTLVVLTLVYWQPGLVLLLVGMTSLGTIEVHDALARIGMNSAKIPLVIGNIAIIGGSYGAAELQKYTNIAWHVVLLGCLGFTVMLVLVWRMFFGSEGFVRDAAASLFTICYIPLLASFIGLILAMDNGSLKLITMVLCVCASDTGGYVVGANLGKHQMAPLISPKKTWEGFVGSLAVSSAMGIVMAVFALGQPWWYGLVLAAVAVVFCTAGDLVESMIKRDVGIKDMSSSIPGHGGVMDRLDSVLFAAPAAWLVLSLPMPL